MIQSPSLDYQHVLDICSQEAYRTQGLIVLLADSSFYIQQFEPRLPNMKILKRDDFGDIPADCSCLILAEAKLEDFGQLLKGLREASQIESVLIIRSGRLARFLPEGLSQKDVIGQTQAEHFLKQLGFSLVWRMGINPLSSLIWGRLMLGFRAFGFHSMADYCLYQMRANYVRQDSWGTVQLFLGRRSV